MNSPCSDPHVESVVELLRSRSNAGLLKYGVTLVRDDLTTLDWLQHLQEELLDAANYIQVLKNFQNVNDIKMEKREFLKGYVNVVAHSKYGLTPWKNDHITFSGYLPIEFRSSGWPLLAVIINAGLAIDTYMYGAERQRPTITLLQWDNCKGGIDIITDTKNPRFQHFLSNLDMGAYNTFLKYIKPSPITDISETSRVTGNE